MIKISNKINLASIIITLITVHLIGYVSINYFGNYGWTVFVLIPILVGFLPPYISSIKLNLTKKDTFILSLTSAISALLSLFIFAIEGLICIIMASPFLIIGTYAGWRIGYKTTQRNFMDPVIIILILLLQSLGFMSLDFANKPNDLISVHTNVVVNQSIEKVWPHLIMSDKIKEPTDWFFKTGISCPTSSKIIGRGIGAIRYSNFTTGNAVEEITTWNAPNLLQFDIKEQPVPMKELSLFSKVHPPHLDGYFKSRKGQFKLTEISKNQTKLEGTTCYKIDIYPGIYWRAWSNFILKRIQHRVLNHIKKESESSQ